MNKRRGKNRKKTGAGPVRAALPWIMLFLLSSALFTALWYYAGSAGMFPLKEVVFTGNKAMSNGELLSRLGVRPGQNMLAISKNELEKRLLSCPWVKAAAVRKEILTGRIAVRVDERKPFVLIRRDGAMWLSDRSGGTLEELKAGTTPFLPVIDADAGRYPETFRQAMLLAGCLKDRGYFEDVVQISALCPPEELSVREPGGEIIRFGAGNFGRKLDELGALSAEIAKKGIGAGVIDLRFANKVIVDPAPALDNPASFPVAAGHSAGTPLSAPSGRGIRQ